MAGINVTTRTASRLVYTGTSSMSDADMLCNSNYQDYGFCVIG